MTFFDLMKMGGAVMWALLALSCAALAIAIERAAMYATSRRPRDVLSPHDDANIPARDLKLILDACVERTARRLERGLGALEAIAKISPLLGLLGTVLGMVEMFGSMRAGGGVSSEAVTGGIWQALFTTVAGLLVAIPTAAVHALLSSRAGRLVDAMEDEAAAMIERRVRDAARP